MTDTPAAKAFNPSEHLIKLQGKDYLQVMWRLVWLRSEHPDAVIVTERLGFDDQFAMFRATVSIPGGGSATAHGMETQSDFHDYAEKAECVHEDTEILTLEGFKRYSALRTGETVAAYNLATDTLEWVPLQAVSVYADAPVVRLGARWFEAVVTPNHSWATAGTYASWVTGEAPRRLRETTELSTSDRIILAAPAPSGDSKITPDEAAILGWLFTDGGLWKGDGSLRPFVCQSKPQNFDRIRELVGAISSERVGEPLVRTFPSGHTYDCLPQHTWTLPVGIVRPLLARLGVTSPADLPAAVTRLSSQARAAMLEAMMEADGDRRGYFGKRRKTGVFEAWRILATLEGRAVGPIRNGDVFPVQRLKRRRYISCSELNATDAGRATVWCPTTPHGTWVAKLPNGQITITGNTKAVGRALGMLGYGTQFAPELDEGQRIVDSPVSRPQATPAPSPAPQRPAAAPARPATPAPAQGPRKATQPTGGVPDPRNMGEVMQLAHDRKGMGVKDVLDFFMAKRTEDIRITPAAAWAKLDHERPDKAGAALFEPEAQAAPKG